MSGRPDSYYEVLGVQPGATLEQLKAAYRRQALRYHPDKCPGSVEAVERFKLCNDAFGVLSDPEKRAAYDRQQLQAKGMPERVGSLIGDLLGGRRRRKRDGRDVTCTVTLSFRDAALGVERFVRFSVLELCGICNGAGAAPGGSRPCKACGGRGDLRARQGLLSLPKPCPHCGGQGVTVVSHCRTCGGVGTVERDRELSVRVPVGVRDGDVKIVEGAGEPGVYGGRAGDLHVVVRVEKDAIFSTQGIDISLDFPVSFADSALGATITVPTLAGTVRMTLPAGTQSGRIFRLRGKGLRRGRARGDQLVRIVVETPVGLGSRQRGLLRAFDESCAEAMRPLQQAFAERAVRSGSRRGG